MACLHPERLATDRYVQSDFPIAIYHHTLGGPIAPHWHEFFELGFVLAGEGTHAVNGTPTPVSRGSLFLLTPADIHALAPASGEALELFDVVFLDEILASELVEILFADPRDHRAALGEPAAGRMEAEFCRLWVEANERMPGYQFVIRGGLERILIDLARLCRGGGPPIECGRPTPQHEAIRRALAHIHSHFREPITLPAVARHALLSPNYFSERFSAITGSPFQTYVQLLRLRFAMALLRVSDAPITVVCHASGFNTLSHFERAFKRQFGKPPSRVRSGPPRKPVL